MIINQIKTKKIIGRRNDLYEILDKYLTAFNEQSVLAITSKIVSICEGRIVKTRKISKQELIEREADYYLPLEKRKYDITLTIKNSLLIPSAGIDESNGGNNYILWPSDSQKTANKIREYLCKRFSIKKVGVIITDSKTTPLRWGVTGAAIVHSGFYALKNYIGEPDIFGKKLRVTKANIMDGLAAAAVLAMGEGDEQTPLAIIKDVSFVHFQERNPNKKELDNLKINIEDDLYSSLLKGVEWIKGKRG